MPETKIEHVVNSTGFSLEFLTLSSIREAFGIFLLLYLCLWSFFFLPFNTGGSKNHFLLLFRPTISNAQSLCFCVGCSGFFFRNVLLFGMPMRYINIVVASPIYLFIDLYYCRKFLELYVLIN